MMLSYVAIGAFFRYYYEPTFGLLSQAVRLFTGEPYILLGTTGGAIAGIVFADAWMWSPFVMLLVLAGLVSVPKYLYEAAAIDRVSAWRRFWSITFPYIRGSDAGALFRTTRRSLFDVGSCSPKAARYSIETIAVYVIAWRSSISDQQSTACLHPVVHRDADQPLSLLRHAGWRRPEPWQDGGRSVSRLGTPSPA
jgi:multiple sugar transport system permease protein